MQALFLAAATAAVRRSKGRARLAGSGPEFRRAARERAHGPTIAAAHCSFLQAFAERLRACAQVDLVARLGGDEFVVLIEDAASIEIAELIANKFLAAMQEPIALATGPLQVSASIGIAFCRTVDSAPQLLALADRALYAAKSAGRNTYRLIAD